MKLGTYVKCILASVDVICVFFWDTLYGLCLFWRWNFAPWKLSGRNISQKKPYQSALETEAIYLTSLKFGLLGMLTIFGNSRIRNWLFQVIEVHLLKRVTRTCYVSCSNSCRLFKCWTDFQVVVMYQNLQISERGLAWS